jgi:hypothetical protein
VARWNLCGPAMGEDCQIYGYRPHARRLTSDPVGTVLTIPFITPAGWTGGGLARGSIGA